MTYFYGSKIKNKVMETLCFSDGMLVRSMGASDKNATNSGNGEEDECDNDDTEFPLVAPPPPQIETETIVEHSSSYCKLNSDGKCEEPGATSSCKHSNYGKPLSESLVRELMDFENGGLEWTARLIPSDFNADYEKTGELKLLSARNYDAANKCIKARRGDLSVTDADFFSSVTKLKDEKSGQYRWVFTGILNGWPSLTCLELRKIQYKGTFPTWKTYWKAFDESDDTDSVYPGSKSNVPCFPVRYSGKSVKDARVILRQSSWSAYGWSKDSPGNVFWFQSSKLSHPAPRLLYGVNIVKQFQEDQVKADKPLPRCKMAHMISHRYSQGNKGESVKDHITYHSIVLIEWDHGKYCTVVESAFRNGVSGYLGKANWILDKNVENNSLYRALPPEMIAPWKSNLSELRVYDVDSKNLAEFLSFMKDHTGSEGRFLDVRHTFSHAVRLTFCSKDHIAQYLINYIRRGRTYSEIRRNCQTFAADFCAFLAGKKDVQPFHPLNRIEYRNQTHYFLYDGSMYE
mmetsp:Transcript_18964/g.26692  ORF Transcript_18964/g.26692 Transcript_18964/m.26692 type:complete len:516 (+) Transcript_18964:134-1681(+)